MCPFLSAPLLTEHIQASLQGNSNGGVPASSPFDPFVTAPNHLSAAGAVGSVQAGAFPHETAAAAAALGGAAFFAGQSGFQQPVSSLTG